MTKPTSLILAMLVLAIGLVACNGGGNQTPVPDPQEETRIILASGGGAVFPAGTFAGVTEVDVTEGLTGAQRDAASFPANSGELLGATTIVVPVGTAMSANITVFIAVSPVQEPNLMFTIFQFNSTTGMWETTAASTVKNIAATGNLTGGSVVGFTASTNGETGFNATFGVFENFNEAETGSGSGTPNEIPAVTLAADSTSVDPGDTVSLTATGTDADGDTLAYTWQAAGGTLGTAAAGGTTNTWNSDTGGAYTVSVAVNDGNGGVATAAVNIAVSIPDAPGPTNDPPTWDEGGEIHAYQEAPVIGQRIKISGPTATDPEGAEVTYAWSGDGTFEDVEGNMLWLPTAEGTATATLTASDGVNDITMDYTTTVAPYPAEFDFVGYASCLGCHGENGDEVAGTGWFGTNHADAIERTMNPGNAYGYRNPSCLGCHALGFSPNDTGQGFIDRDLTPEYGNIQCESCHGAGDPGGNAMGPMNINWGPEVGMIFDEGSGEWHMDDTFVATNGIGCGRCHEGSRHGSFEEWSESGHALMELTEMDDEVDPPVEIPNHTITGDSCNYCHSGQEYIYVTIDGNEPRELDTLTLAETPDHRIGCATCHDPHEAANEKQLRWDNVTDVPIPFSAIDDVPTMVDGGWGNICISCHNGRRDRGDYDDRVWGGSRHFGPHGNPQGPVLFGIMGGDLGDPPVPTTYEADHPHLDWNENTCTTCHMYNRPYISSDEPHLWGHNFEPRFERCITCHTNFSDETEFDLWVAEYEAEVEVLLQAFRDVWPAEWLDGDGEPENRDDGNVPSDNSGPPRDHEVGAAYRAALWNYMLVLNDDSMGVHNPTFTKSLLEKATAAVEALPDPPIPPMP